MRKIILVLTAILCVAVPLVAQAATWSLNTWVKTVGGSMSVRGGAPQTSLNGSVFKSYTTSKTFAVTVNANTGYTISSVNYNGVVINSPSQTSYTVHGATAQNVYASFAARLLSITAEAGAGGSVNPASIGTIVYGQKPISPVKFTFTPNTGFSVVSISGVPVGATVVPALPAAVNTSVVVTFPTSFTFSGDIALAGVFSGPPVAVISPPVTVLLGSPVTLDGSGSTGAVTSWTWSQTGGPGFPATKVIADNTPGAQVSFTPTLLGSYALRLTVTGGSTAFTSVTVTNSAAGAARSQCQNCHQANNIGSSQNVFNNWSSSQHRANLVLCARCHVGTNTGSHPGTLTAGTVNEATFTYTSGGASFCLNGTCHNPGITHKTVGMTCAACHSSGEIHNPNASFATAVNICFGCHGGVNTLHYFANSSIGADNCRSCHNPSGHNPAPAATVPRVHFNGYTSYVNPGYAAAYVTPTTQCTDCHKGGDPASPGDLAILQYRTEWAASGHGDIKGAPWVNSASHNWKASGMAGVRVSVAGAATDCQRCHTATGYVLFSNTTSIAPIAAGAPRYSEPLTCNACHNQDFTLRGVTPRTGYYNYTSASTGRLLVSALLPDSRTSNICLGCHVGREAGDTIKAMAAATAHKNYSTSFWKNVSFLNSHYLTAGGQVFGVTGYEYPGFGYANTVDHSQVGSGAGGPCVTCHMPGKTHTLAPATASFIQCNTCHGGALDSTFIASKTANFDAALKALGTALTQKGFAPNLVGGVLSYPYFSTKNWGNKDTGPGNMGAAFNYNLLVHDPGAFAHNPTYAKRLVRDSLDYLINGGVDRSRDLSAAVDALLTNPTERADANAFLLNSANGSSACAVCHGASVDLAGNRIVATYNLSLHSTVAGGPSCGSCHAPGAALAHPPSMTMLSAPADIAAKCFGCHGVPHSWPSLGKCVECHNGHNPKQVHVGYPHFSSYSTAQYATRNISCNNCHFQAGVPTFNVYSANFQWSKSGHGDPLSAAYVGPGPYTEANLEAYDFKFLGTPLPATAATTVQQDCVRCHTATGYANYVTPTDVNEPKTAFANIQAWGTPGDRTREMVSCPACHNPTPFNASFGRRNVGIIDDESGGASSYTSVVKGWYNYSSAVTKKITRSKLFVNPSGFDSDMTDSNICITCHSGRATGDLIRQSASCVNLPSIACRVGNGNATTGLNGTFWGNVDFIDPHGGGAANFMFPDGQHAGYEYKAGAVLVPYHININIGAANSTQGPCVGCHMSSANKHSFSVISTASNGIISGIRTDLCLDCHGSLAAPIDPAALQAKKSSYAASLAFIQGQLAGKGIYYNRTKAPYFFTVSDPAQQTPATRVVNWNRDATFKGANLMGAAFNLRLLDSSAGWVHNGSYAKRLLFDTIDYLNDGALDFALGVPAGAVHDYIYPRP
jgi:trimeric autotransporter adhesin